MYKLCRAALTIAVVEFLYGIGVAMLAGWPWSFIGVMGAIAFQKLKKGRLLWAHGTARWATEGDLRKAGMIDSDKGLMIGRLGDSTRPTWQQVAPALIDPRLDAKAACAQFLRVLSPSKKAKAVRLSKSVHSLICIPTGGGKGTSFLIPWLEAQDEAAVILDIGGAAAKVTALHRERRFGHRVGLFDPYRVVTNRPDTLNPLDAIAKGSLDAIDCCRGIAKEIVVRTGKEQDNHWNDSSELVIAGACMAVIQHAEIGNRSLQTAVDIVSHPDKYQMMVELLRRSEGLLPRFGDQLSHFVDRELASVITTTVRNMSFLSTPAIVESTSTSSLDPAELRSGKMTIFCILPPDRIRDQRGLLRLWLGTIVRAVIRGGRQDG